MKKISTLKLQIFCLAIAVSSHCNIVNAKSIQFAVDASLEQQDLDVIRDVVTTISQAADVDNSIGVVVYDGVFQRGTPIAIADEAQKTDVRDTLLQLTSSDSSNLAVGIEKGISELGAEGGHLIIFGHSEIKVTDPEKLATYNDWVKWVLLPDAEKNGVNVVLVGPAPLNESNSFHTSVAAFYPLSDAASIINDLSAILPESLVGRLGDPIQLSELTEAAPADQPEPLAVTVDTTVDSEPLAVAVDTPIDELEIISESNSADTAVLEENQLSRMELLLIGFSIALLFALVAMGYLIRKLLRKGKSKPSAIDSQAANRAAQVATATTARKPSYIQQDAPVLAADDAPTAPRQPPAYSEIDTEVEDRTLPDPDATVKNPAVQADDLDSTLRRSPSKPQSWNTKNDTETLAELDEIRNLTKQREDSLI